MLSYLATEGLADRSVSLTGLMLAALGIPATIAWGALTDRVGRRPVYILGTIVTAAWGIPLFLLVNTSTAVVIVITFASSATRSARTLAGVQGAWFSELFAAGPGPPVPLAYQLSAVVAGFSPLVATALYAWVGWVGPALMLTFYGLLGLAAALITRETWGPAERAAVDALEHDAARNASDPEPQRVAALPTRPPRPRRPRRSDRRHGHHFESTRTKRTTP